MATIVYIAVSNPCVSTFYPARQPTFTLPAVVREEELKEELQPTG